MSSSGIDRAFPYISCGLISVIEKEGAMTHEDAEEYLNEMKKQGRYQRDIY